MTKLGAGTAVGNLAYWDGTNWVVLAPAASRKFLKQAAAEAPAWDTLVAADIAGLSPSFVVLTLSQADGVAPMTVTSTTVVSNLNVDKVDGYDLNQALLIASSPTFAGLTLSGDLSIAANKIKTTNILLKELSSTYLAIRTVADDSYRNLGLGSAAFYGACYFGNNSEQVISPSPNTLSSNIISLQGVTGAAYATVARVVSGASPYFDLVDARLQNSVSLQSYETGGTVRSIISMNASNQILLGNTANQLYIIGSGTNILGQIAQVNPTMISRSATATSGATTKSSNTLQFQQSRYPAGGPAVTFTSNIYTTPVSADVSTGILCLDLFTTQLTVGAAGAASALPATPTGYIRVKIDTVDYVIPYYAQA